MTEIVGETSSYRTIKKVAESIDYQLYLSTQVGTERQCLLQIASAVTHNGELQRVAFLLKELENQANQLEKEYEDVKTDPNVLLNYGLGFPELIEDFICPEQGGRQINILAFKNVDEINRMVPLSNITNRDQKRIDLRSSAWIMGKLLKMLAFTHNQGILVGLLTGNNVLIEPKEHYVVIFDWFFSEISSEMIPREAKREEISAAAKTVITALGGDLETGTFPDDSDEDSLLYTNYLLGLARGKESDAQKAHDEFYKLVDSLWEREYYPFETKPLNKKEA